MSMFPRLYVPPCLYPSPLIGPPFTLTLEKVIITGKNIIFMNVYVCVYEDQSCYFVLLIPKYPQPLQKVQVATIIS